MRGKPLSVQGRRDLEPLSSVGQVSSAVYEVPARQGGSGSEMGDFPRKRVGGVSLSILERWSNPVELQETRSKGTVKR